MDEQHNDPMRQPSWPTNELVRTTMHELKQFTGREVSAEEARQFIIGLGNLFDAVDVSQNSKRSPLDGPS